MVDCAVEYFGDRGRAHERPRPRDARQHGARVRRDLRLLRRSTTRRSRYLRSTGRSDAHVALVERYARAAGLFRDREAPVPQYSRVVDIDLGDARPTVAGPSRPQDGHGPRRGRGRLPPASRAAHRAKAASCARDAAMPGIPHGAVGIAAITSCTNTSNPSVMIAAGLVARNCVRLGVAPPAWVKTSLAPGSQAVTRYLEAWDCWQPLARARLRRRRLRLHDLRRQVGTARARVRGTHRARRSRRGLGAVRQPQLSRPHPQAHPGQLPDGAAAGRRLRRRRPHRLRSGAGAARGECRRARGVPARRAAGRRRSRASSSRASTIPRSTHASDPIGPYDADYWKGSRSQASDAFAWDAASTYLVKPPFFDVASGDGHRARCAEALRSTRVLVMLGASATTDHISPSGEIPADAPSGRYLLAHGVAQKDFNTYVGRRGNHHVMVRGTFANVRLRNRLTPDVEGGFTLQFPERKVVTVFDAATHYQSQGVATIVLAGADYGTGSSRDWAAKGTALLGVKAVIAESFERIHRANLIGMGVLPLAFEPGQGIESLGLRGDEDVPLRRRGRGRAAGHAHPCHRHRRQDHPLRRRRADLHRVAAAAHRGRRHAAPGDDAIRQVKWGGRPAPTIVSCARLRARMPSSPSRSSAASTTRQGGRNHSAQHFKTPEIGKGRGRQ